MTASNPEFEADCIRRIQAGEKHLFHDLIRPCERSMYFLLLSLLRNEAEAEEAAQETVIKVYLNLHHFRGDSQFAPGYSRLPAMKAWEGCARRETAAKIRWMPRLTSRPGTILQPS